MGIHILEKTVLILEQGPDFWMAVLVIYGRFPPKVAYMVSNTMDHWSICYYTSAGLTSGY